MRIAAVLIPATLLALLATSSTASAQAELEFKFPEGRTSTYESTTQVEQTLTVGGQEIPTQSKQTSLATSSVGAKRDDGKVPVTQKIESIHVELSLPGGIDMTIDSKNPEEPADEQPQFKAIRETIQALGGISYTVLFDADGTVVGIEGLEDAIPKDVSPEVADSLGERLTSEVLIKEYKQEYGILPDGPVSEGQTWERSEELNLGEGQTMTFQRQYTYRGTVDRAGKTLDRIEIVDKTVDYQMTNPASPVKIEESNLTIASSKGEILFDREAGQVVENRISTDITGSLVLAAGGQEIPAELVLTIMTGSTLDPQIR